MDNIFDEIKAYVGFSPADQEALKELHPLLADRFGAIVDDFYARIEAHPQAAQVITGGTVQIERLKCTLHDFLHEFFAGPWDDDYYERRARIGRRHVEVGLAQHYMMTALGAIREQLCVGASAVTRTSARTTLERRIAAINKLCDLELAVMLHTYSEDTARQLRSRERLATYGELMSAICHELRNPLGVIETSTYLLRDQLAETAPPPLASHLQRIQRHVRRATRIITGMLEIVREQPLTLRTVELDPLARRAMEVLHEERQRTVHYVPPPAGTQVLVDAQLLQQVLLNLLHNAADATQENGEIFLKALADADAIYMVVCDNGPGVPEEVRHRLFEPLVTTKPNGVGMGLALSAKLARQLGGRIRLVDSGGSGACFELRLPPAVETLQHEIQNVN